MHEVAKYQVVQRWQRGEQVGARKGRRLQLVRIGLELEIGLPVRL